MRTMKTSGCVGVSVMVFLLMKTTMAEEEDPSTLRDSNREQWERRVRSASSLEELLRLTDFPDWKLWKCRQNLQTLEAPPQPKFRSSSSSFLSSSSSFLSSSSSSSGSHRSTRYAADSFSLEILKAIDEEWQSTQCMPREACVDVAKELGSSPSMFFKPPCVSVFRCGGCCNQEGVACRNISTTYVNKTLLSVIPFKYGPEPVLIRVANHTQCRCMEPALIRRHARPHRRNGCSPRQRPDSGDPRRLCSPGLIWDCLAERCVLYPSSPPVELTFSGGGPDCEIDLERCGCVAPPLQP
ncbi:vascular endothelial growth factor D [Osmerus mordax]|uniref:vascular endothelial growth factor D n=1 Tax=Osmerus mordax TaxID=8014 RepID=UPI00350FF9F5